MTYHTEKIETAIAKIHECLDAPIDPVRVRRLLKDIGKWSAEAEREAYARGKAAADKQRAASEPAAWINEAGNVEPISDAVKQARPDLYAKGYTRPLFYAAPQASTEESAIDKPIPDSVEHYGLIDERVGTPAAEDSAKGAGDGDLHFIAGTIVLHLKGPVDPAGVIAASRSIKAWIDRQQRGGDVKHIADDTRVGILADSSYLEGVRVGYSLGQFSDEAQYRRIIESMSRQLREARAELAAPPASDACLECQGLGEARKSLGGDPGEHEELGDCLACDGTGKQPAASAEPVAIVGPDFTLFWIGSGPIEPLVQRHGLKVGSPLFAAPVTAYETGGQS